jgi:5-methylcytosine-specific restriction endonuclease McrA
VSSDFRPAKRVKDPEFLKHFRMEHLNELCAMCDMRPGAHIHHRILRSQGGGDVPENCVWLCTSCHSDVHGIREIVHDL